ncbi:hypothetical protein BOX15_Mlig013967g1, partial [Macrostomum lignano]
EPQHRQQRRQCPSIDSILDDAQASRQTLKLSPETTEFARRKYGISNGYAHCRQRQQQPPPQPPPPPPRSPSPPTPASPPASASSAVVATAERPQSPLQLLRDEAEVAALQAMLTHMRAGVQAGNEIRESLEQQFDRISKSAAAATAASQRSRVDEREANCPELAAIEAAEAAERRAAERGRANLSEAKRLLESLPARPQPPDGADTDEGWRTLSDQFSEARMGLYRLAVQSGLTDCELREARRFYEAAAAAATAAEAAAVAAAAEAAAAEAAAAEAAAAEAAAAEAAAAEAAAAEAAAAEAAAAEAAAAEAAAAAASREVKAEEPNSRNDPPAVYVTSALPAAVSAPSAAVPAPSAAVPAPSAAVPIPSAAVPAPSAAVPGPSAAVPAPSAAVPAQSAPGANNSTDSGWRWRKCREKLATLRAQLTDLINGATPELMTFKMAIQTTLQNRLAQFCASDEPQLMRQRQQQTMLLLLKIFSMEPFVSFYQQRKISSIRSVPNGEQFAMYTYCECLLMQAEDQFSEPAKLRPDEEGADHLFCLRIAQSLAMATAMLCSCSKAFQPMLLSFLLAQCPLLLPHPPPPDWEAGRELDDRVMRCRSLGRLYAALFCAPPLMGSFSRPKEFSLNHMWSLAAGLVRLSATGRHSHLLTCATLHSVLEVAGASMWRRYGAQFVKLVRSALKLYDQESYFIDSSAVLLVQYLQFVLAAGFITDLGATSSASQLMSSA